MVQVIMKPEIFKYATCKEFAEGFALGAEDLVLTNKFIFEPYFGPLGLKVHTIFQEEYGMGEPTDVMCESIMQDAAKTGCKRIIAIGGGTVIDIAKALAVATEDASMDSLYSVMPALTRKYELVIIPTTCGTGSEVTNIAVFNRTRMGTKMGLVGEAIQAALHFKMKRRPANAMQRNKVRSVLIFPDRLSLWRSRSAGIYSRMPSCRRGRVCLRLVFCS